MKQLLLATLCTVLPAFAVAQGSAAPCGLESLRLTMVPKKNIDRQIAEFQPLARLLGEGLGVPVTIMRASSYESVIDAVVSGGVDIAELGPASYIQAYQRAPGVEPFASLERKKGVFTPAGSHYQALLMVRSDSGIDTLDKARNTRVALNDPSSTSGALIPNFEFPERSGMALARFFSAQVYTGSHDKSLDALLARRVDAAFVSSARADEYLERGLIERNTLRVLWASQPIHYDPFVFRAGLCPELKQAIRRLVLTPSPRQAEFLQSVHANAFNPVEHASYQPLLRLMAAH